MNVKIDTKETNTLENAPWALHVLPSSPNQFELTYQNQPLYVGQLEVFNNGELLELTDLVWQFRQKPQRIEQWCQLRHTDTLSVNMNYYFHQDALVIEYLARNSVPTRLDIRHHIQSLVSQQQREDVSMPTLDSKAWRRKRNGMPSDFLSQTEKTDFFREAFSATQWILLGKM